MEAISLFERSLDEIIVQPLCRAGDLDQYVEMLSLDRAFIGAVGKKTNLPLL